MSAARMKHFGWGREGEGLSAEEEAFVLARAEATVEREGSEKPVCVAELIYRVVAEPLVTRTAGPTGCASTPEERTPSWRGSGGCSCS